MFGVTSAIIASITFLTLLFVIAYVSNLKQSHRVRELINTPVVYTLSLTVYCTSWTFYGAVGTAAVNGLEFATIYLGPTLVFLGWWFILRKLVRISKTHRLTSIADFISSRYGKSTSLSVLVTLMAVIGTTPYIALQLKAISTSFQVVSEASQGFPDYLSGHTIISDTGFWVALVMAAFIVLFGTRNIGADEHHAGVVAAIAFESLVKLFALLAVGIFVVTTILWGNYDHLVQNEASAEILKKFTFKEESGARWITMLILSAAAIICLPRQFQVTVVEINDERNLRTASWLFPLYLFLISIFIMPIAYAGLLIMPAGSNPDVFVLTVPLKAGAHELALLAFIGGFSSATSMMIVASIALSIMLSNHIIMPVLFRISALRLESRKDLSQWLLTTRRFSILFILLLGYIYYRYSAKSNALASIGLVSFAAVAQFLPTIIGSLYWKNGTKQGAVAGLSLGFLVWAFTLLLPIFERSGYSLGLLQHGLFGISWLRPEALFGLNDWDPLVHSLFWSYSANIGAYIIVSLCFNAKPLERLQSALFVDAFRHSQVREARYFKRSAAVEDLLDLTTRILGAAKAEDLFRQFAETQGEKGLPEPSPELIAYVERHLASSIGAASARVMVSRVSIGETISLEEVIEILDETQQVIEYSQQLEQKSNELEEVASQLREANTQLKHMDKLKDDFLTRVSHELRTPMTSIRSFSEILLQEKEIETDQQDRFLNIIVSESQRLTRLLDEILDISQLEEGHGAWKDSHINPHRILKEAIASSFGSAHAKGVDIIDDTSVKAFSTIGDSDRLMQVFINLISNAIKFNNNENAYVRISSETDKETFTATVTDNGPGIASEDHELIFSKFERKWENADGSGLGLAISRQIIERMGGKIQVQSKLGEGASFRITLFRAGDNA
ncbi:MAG: ATP-binding protein [Methyloligellaceae bacterium]